MSQLCHVFYRYELWTLHNIWHIVMSVKSDTIFFNTVVGHNTLRGFHVVETTGCGTVCSESVIPLISFTQTVIKMLQYDIITRTSEWVITLWRSWELFLRREISLPKTMNMISTDDHDKLILVFMPYYYWLDIDFNGLCTILKVYW